MDPSKWNQSQIDSMADSSVLWKGNESEQERHSQCDNKEKEYIYTPVAQRRKSISGILTGLHSSFDMADVEITSFKIDSLVASETLVKTDKSIISEVEDLTRNDVSDVSDISDVPDQTLTTPNSCTSSDVKTDNDVNDDTTVDAIQENRVNLTRTPSKRKVFVKARLIGDNANVDKAQREIMPLENERSQTSLGIVGNEDHDRPIQENINQSKPRSHTPGLPPIPRSKTSSTSRRNMKRIQVSPRVDLLMNSDLFRKNLENHKDLLNSVGYSFGMMKKSVSNLDLSIPFDHEGKSDSENVKSVDLANGTSNLDKAWTNSRRDEKCSENSSEILCAENRNKELNSHRNPALKTSSRRYSLAMEADSSFDIYTKKSHPPSVMGRNCIPSFDEFKRQRKQKLLNSCSDSTVLNPKSPATLKNEISNLVFDFEHSLKLISEEANRENKENANSNSTHEIVQLHTAGLQCKANRRLLFSNSSKKQKQMASSQHESLGNQVKFKPSSQTSLEEFKEESINDISAITSSPNQTIREKETDSIISEQHFENKTCNGFSLDTEERQETNLRNTETSFKKQETCLIKTDTSFKRKENDLVETDTSFERQENETIEKDTSFERQETDLVEIHTSFKRKENDLVETDTSFERQENDTIEKDTSFERQENDIVEIDTSFERQNNYLVETDTSFERQETDLVETDTSFKRKETDLVETDTSFKRKENNLSETDPSFVSHETYLIDMNTLFAESANASLPISNNILKSKSESCSSHRHEKHSNSIKKKLLSVISLGSGKKKNESVSNAKTCQNPSVQESVYIQTDVHKYIHSNSSASQKQGTHNHSEPCKGNDSSLMHNRTEYRGSNSSMTEDSSEVFFLTRQASITSSIHSIPDSLNAENVDKFREFDDYEYEDRRFSIKGDNVSPVLRSTSDACNATAEAVQKRRERKERPYKSDPFTGLENLPAPGLRHHRSFASSSREEILSFLGNATVHSRFTHHDSSPSLEELHEDDDEDESLPDTAFEKERKGRNRLSSASMTSTDSGVIGQDSQTSPTSTLSVTHTSTWPDFQSHDLSHDTTSIVRSQSEMAPHQKVCSSPS
ncbi:hypothetical protein ACJMK2_013252 [Sinanodonta woodiana]|uniref:Uncharacterized protein n=1 Tax=Sinanodonta woodiana TaxID=1069815 RepID=A0ABD3UY77_SINWO